MYNKNHSKYLSFSNLLLHCVFFVYHSLVLHLQGFYIDFRMMTVKVISVRCLEWKLL